MGAATQVTVDERNGCQEGGRTDDQHHHSNTRYRQPQQG
jgi:hypothetical protein